MTMEYTKGEWKALPIGTGLGWYIDAPDREIAKINHVLNNGEARANAHLIASAPKLHKACVHAKGLVASFNRVSDKDWLVLLEELHEALRGV